MFSLPARHIIPSSHALFVLNVWLNLGKKVAWLSLGKHQWRLVTFTHKINMLRFGKWLGTQQDANSFGWESCVCSSTSLNIFTFFTTSPATYCILFKTSKTRWLYNAGPLKLFFPVIKKSLWRQDVTTKCCDQTSSWIWEQAGFEWTAPRLFWGI